MVNWLPRKRWMVEAYHPISGKACVLTRDVVPLGRFWTRRMADHEVWALNNLAGLQGASHRYRVVPV